MKSIIITFSKSKYPIIPIFLDCQDCYGAQLSENQCCDECIEVVRAYQHKDWSFDRTQFSQCATGMKIKTCCTLDNHSVKYKKTADINLIPIMCYSNNRMDTIWSQQNMSGID